MTSVPYDLQRRVGRFRNQRWLLDTVVKLVGLEFDQSPLHCLSASIGPDFQGAVMGVKGGLKPGHSSAPSSCIQAIGWDL